MAPEESMADVILAHRVTRGGRCSCGAVLSDDSPASLAKHGEAALAAAGFGLMAEAWLEGRNSQPDRFAPNPYWIAPSALGLDGAPK
jgi:hypothetical protein